NAPRLVIADPENTSGSLSEEMKKEQARGAKTLHLPDFIIASHLEELDVIRFYLKAGARDYILKPIRPNELVAKVERAIQQISNREVLILKNDVDGVQISNL